MCGSVTFFQLAGEREVKAHVRLKFINVRGERITCSRILQSEQKVSLLKLCTCTFVL